MDFVFVKKICFALIIIGIIAIIYNSITIIINQKLTIYVFLTLVQILICTVVMAIGYRFPRKWVAYFQAAGAWLVAFLALLDCPGDFPGIFFAIISYLLFIEHKIIINTIHKIILIATYFLPVLLSILILNRDYAELPRVYLLTSFFCFCMYVFFQHKKKHDRETIEKSIKIIGKLEPYTEELLEISKRQAEIINAQAAQIEEFKKLVDKGFADG